MFRQAIRLSVARGYTKQCFSVENREEYEAQGVKSASHISHDRAGAAENNRGSATVAPLAQNIDQSSESDFLFFLKFLKGDRIQISFKKTGCGRLFKSFQSGLKCQYDYITIYNITWRERSIDITAVRAILRV